LDPRFAGSNTAEYAGFLRAIKFRSTTASGGELKPSAPCRKIFGMLKNPAEYDRDISSEKSTPFLAKYFLLHNKMYLLSIARELWCMNQE
jgi:hypothetical protein